MNRAVDVLPAFAGALILIAARLLYLVLGRLLQPARRPEPRRRGQAPGGRT